MERERAVAEHTIDSHSRRCIVCGLPHSDILAGNLPCAGVAAAEDLDLPYEAPTEHFLPPPGEYDHARNSAHENDDDGYDFYPLPPRPRAAGNVLCPVCAGRPCLATCTLGPWTAAEIAALDQSFLEGRDGRPKL